MSGAPRQRARQPETLAQAQTFDRINRQALTYGLCRSCAAQLAYGHGLGFATVRTPCSPCVLVIATLPKPQPNGWRSVVGDARQADAWQNRPQMRHTEPSRAGTPGKAPRLTGAARGERFSGVAA